MSADIEFLENEYQALKTNAKKQRQLLTFILGHMGEKWSKRDLQAQLAVHDAVLNHAVTHQWLTKTRIEQLRDPLATVAVGPTSVRWHSIVNSSLLLKPLYMLQMKGNINHFYSKGSRVPVKQKFTCRQRNMFIIREKPYYFWCQKLL